MLGNWLGLRPCLTEHGIQVDAHLTQFYQGVASGGEEQTFRYGDKLDLYLVAELDKLGLWEGGSLQIHAVDWQFGQNAIVDAVGLAPINANLLTPDAEPSFALTHMLYEQQLGGGWVGAVGRVNLLDLWTNFFPEYGRGVDGFMNVSAMLPLSVLPSLPIISNAAGILKAGERGLEAGFIVFEDQNSPTTVGLDFPNGVTMFGFGRRYTDLGGLPGSHMLAGVFATGRYTSFDDKGWTIIPERGLVPDEKPDTWMAAYIGEQKLWVNPATRSDLRRCMVT